MANHREAKKQTLKQDIYDITGISDISRGQTDARETASAQKIKGLFGSLRFQDRQKLIQNFNKKVCVIITELICEHWDAQTLSEITCSYLPTEEEKERIKDNLKLRNELLSMARANPSLSAEIKSGVRQIPNIPESEIEKLNQPTWNDVLEIMRNDKLRSFTIDIETDATAFDNIEQQNRDILNLSNTYSQVVTQAATLRDPNIIRGFLPIAKMMLTNIKSGRALANQLIEALENASKTLEEKQSQPDRDWETTWL